MVVAGRGEADETADRGDVDDAAASLLAHAGEDGVGERDQAEEVGLKHGADLLVFTLFDGCEVTIPCVVDEDVDAAEFLLRLLDGLRHLRAVGYVKLEGKSRLLVSGDDVLQLIGFASGDDGAPAASKDEPGQLPAEAGRATGDEPDRG